jgi:hypothetical protein
MTVEEIRAELVAGIRRGVLKNVCIPLSKEAIDAFCNKLIEAVTTHQPTIHNVQVRDNRDGTWLVTYDVRGVVMEISAE